MNKKWEFYEENSEEIIDIAKKHNISELLTKILVNRGITDDKEIDTFLNPTRNDFYDPYLMPDMDKAVERIIKAINNQEKVMIYGDYDVDGITSITVLKKFLEERGLKTGHYIPNRLEEGYGLNENAIRSIAEQKYTLMITVDCGISGIEEVELANQLGIETIITDHHEQSESLPNAYAIINAKRKDSQYPFRGLAGCGAVFKLIQAISLRLGLEEKEFLKYLDIVCVGTISDIVPLVDENRVIAKLGLKLVAQTRNIGLRELILQSGYKKIDSNTISFGVAPRINACGRMGYQEEALDLFLTNNIEEARKITARLNSYNLERQTKEKDIFEQAIKELEKEDIEKLNTIVLSGDNWHHGVIGIVASKLTEKFYKPTILICFEDNIGKGSGRSLPGFDLHEALVETSAYLEKYGGHEMAVGLSLKKEKYNDFKLAFEEIAKSKNIQQIIPVIKIDSIITAKDVNKKTIQDLEMLEPFGEKNKNPIFVYKNLKIDSIRALSEGKHLKLTLKDDNLLINAIGFNLGYLSEEYLIGDKIDIAGNLEINKYGRRRDNPNKYKRCYEINIEKGNLYAKQRKCNNR
ncbi:MAG: single-stranded-DNA-specific exonuclease RecJ [Clostridia bacterium]|jgi:single-stranded-DNA-specific exonuclease recJ|nr:single-stranded-DNA-specific exonuclease RecJ [Clostridiaceae bacterium]